MFGGVVVHGDGLGKTIGYPTANLDILPSATKLKDGVYAVFAKWKNKNYKAALIVMSDVKKVEVHFLEYDGNDFYGDYVEVDPVQKVSEIEFFEEENIDDLVEKIKSDMELVKEILVDKN